MHIEKKGSGSRDKQMGEGRVLMHIKEGGGVKDIEPMNRGESCVGVCRLLRFSNKSLFIGLNAQY